MKYKLWWTKSQYVCYNPGWDPNTFFEEFVRGSNWDGDIKVLDDKTT